MQKSMLSQTMHVCVAIDTHYESVFWSAQMMLCVMKLRKFRHFVWAMDHISSILSRHQLSQNPILTTLPWCTIYEKHHKSVKTNVDTKALVEILTLLCTKAVDTIMHWAFDKVQLIFKTFWTPNTLHQDGNLKDQFQGHKIITFY